MYEHAVIHFQGPKGSPITVESIFDSRFAREDGEYTEYNYLDYDMTYADTLPRLSSPLLPGVKTQVKAVCIQ